MKLDTYKVISNVALNILTDSEKQTRNLHVSLAVLFDDNTIDDLINVLETTQEILADNTGDERLTKAVQLLRSMTKMELDKRDKERYK